METLIRIFQDELSHCLYPKPIRGLLFHFPRSITSISGTGILTCCPSDMLFSLSLGPTNPWLTDIAMETLDIRRTGFSPVLRYSSQHSHFYTLQQLLTGHLHSVGPSANRSCIKRSPTSRLTRILERIAASESTLAPLNFRRRIS